MSTTGIENLPSDDDIFVRAARRDALLDDDRLRIARELQEKMRDLGLVPKPIGSILLETGALTPDQFNRLTETVQRVKDAFRIPGYKLLERLGRGSMGTVYKARQLNLDRVVAIKILAPFLASNQAYVRRFMKEARVIGRLNHPNVVQGFDAGEAGGVYYFAMEYCEGPTLLQILKRGGAMDEERAINIVTQVAHALDHADEQGLVHRDVKPDNVMIVEGGVAKLCDLGLAKDVAIESGSTERGSTVGTPNYISPEQARGEGGIDIRSDIYSLGATFYHLLTGIPPFDGPNPAVIMVKHLNEAPVPPRQLMPTVHPRTERVVLRMLAKNPKERYQTPRDLLDDLWALANRDTEELPPIKPQTGLFRKRSTLLRRGG